MKDQIFIRDLRVQGIIGALLEERTQPQEIVLNLVLDTDTRPAAGSDDLGDAVNYAAVAAEVTAYVAQHAPHLVEKLAADLAALILDTQPRVTAVRVRVEKPAALPSAAGVGVEILRRRASA